MENQSKPILVIGVGNVLLQDEGIGVHVARRLLELDLPGHVEVIDAGTAAIDMVHAIEGREKLVVIDALHLEGEEPGSIYRITPDQLQPTFRGKTSVHQIGLIEVLEMAHLIGRVPETVIFGVVPKTLSAFGLEPTPEIRARIPELVRLVLDEIGLSSHPAP